MSQQQPFRVLAVGNAFRPVESCQIQVLWQHFPCLVPLTEVMRKEKREEKGGGLKRRFPFESPELCLGSWVLKECC